MHDTHESTSITENPSYGYRETLMNVNVVETLVPLGYGKDGMQQDVQPCTRPLVVVNNALHEIADNAQQAMEEAYHPPQVFLRGGMLVYVRIDEQHIPHIVPLGEAALRDRLSQIANFVMIRAVGDDLMYIPVNPPKDVVKILLARHNWRLPALRGITEVPVLGQDGAIHMTPGYDPVTQLFYAPAFDLQVPPIPLAPTKQGVLEAVAFLHHELLADFPFVPDANEGSASYANALGLLLTPIVRPLFNGLAPLALLDKPQQGNRSFALC
jgi:hypothetical protein